MSILGMGLKDVNMAALNELYAKIFDDPEVKKAEAASGAAMFARTLGTDAETMLLVYKALEDEATFREFCDAVIQALHGTYVPQAY